MHKRVACDQRWLCGGVSKPSGHLPVTPFAAISSESSAPAVKAFSGHFNRVTGDDVFLYGSVDIALPLLPSFLSLSVRRFFFFPCV